MKYEKDLDLIEKMFSIDINKESFIKEDLKKYFYLEKTSNGKKYHFELENGPSWIEMYESGNKFVISNSFKDFLNKRGET